MEHDRLILLGTKGGPAVRPGGPMPTASLLWLQGKPIIVDCGLGVTRSAVNAGLDLRRLSLIFITHLHSDHVLELGALVHTAWTTGLKEQLTIYGPAGTQALWDGFLASLAFDCDIRVRDEGRIPLVDLVQIIEYGPGIVLDEGGIRISALRVEHPPVTDCFALRFEAGPSVVFSADTRFFPPLADFARGADVLVHEALLPAGVDALVARSNGGEKLRRHINASHSTAAEAGLIATKAGVGRLVLHHLVPADDTAFGPTDWHEAVRKSWQGDLDIGHDGLVIALPQR
ncbi:MBL fold metallo-hydrolase [Roseicyclus sp.]|uniref:MBL fold metallo-hydrolase n=1 Tax=Roseicyclus sp. TaxID=1914329 RepID=UPI003F6C6CDB